MDEVVSNQQGWVALIRLPKKKALPNGAVQALAFFGMGVDSVGRISRGSVVGLRKRKKRGKPSSLSKQWLLNRTGGFHVWLP